VVSWADFEPALFGPYKLFPYWEQRVENDEDHLTVGLIESIILSRARFFLGTATSTFSDHIFQLMRAAGNHHGAQLAQLQYDKDTGHTSAAYPELERPKGFKPAAQMTPLALEVLEGVTSLLPRHDQLYFDEETN
jgi:hypothetical protein